MTEVPFDYDSDARAPRAIEELRQLARNPGLLRALVERNIKIRYKRSFLGVAWTMLNPAAMMAVLTLVFARAFSATTPRYPAYVLPGLLMWNFFAQTTQIITAEVAAGVDLWRRVRVPKTALAIATALTGLVNLTIAVVPLVVILSILRQPLGIPLLSLVPTMLAAFLFTLGFALVCATGALYFPDVADMLTMILTAWMFATPVIYPMSIIAPRWHKLLLANPMALYVEAFRAPLYENVAPEGTSIAVAFAVAMGALILGWLLFTRCANDITRRG